MRPLYIFDLDGTLADISHRRHFVENKANRWTEFYAACTKDAPNRPVILTAQALAGDNEIWIFSGRSDEVWPQTRSWLLFNSVPYDHLQMRPEGDYTPDDVLKKQWLDNMLVDDRERLVAVFEDRDRMVRMWRAAGVPCFQVAPGDF